MKLAQIVLPKGPHLYAAHNWLEEQIVKRWHGYTALVGKGMWVDADGNGLFEEVVIYQVAMERADVIHLRELAKTICGIADQQCVMIVTPMGDVEFVKNNAAEPLTTVSNPA